MVLVGPSAGGYLRDLQKRIGGKVPTDLPNSALKRAIGFARDAVTQTIEQDGTIAFNLTYFRAVDGVLRQTNPLARLFTAQELL